MNFPMLKPGDSNDRDRESWRAEFKVKRAAHACACSAMGGALSSLRPIGIIIMGETNLNNNFGGGMLCSARSKSD